MDSREDQARAPQWRNRTAAWMPPPTHRYAVTLFGRRVTPWRLSMRAAMDDALAEGHATQEPGCAPYMWVGVDLVSEPLP
jgi:hypothetical protein